jgi:hypothetical protein
VRNAVRDQLPAAAEIVRLVDEWIAVVDLMEIDADVCRSRVVARCFNVADRAPTDDTAWSSKIGSQCRPPSVVFQMPPDAAPA